MAMKLRHRGRCHGASSAMRGRRPREERATCAAVPAQFRNSFAMRHFHALLNFIGYSLQRFSPRHCHVFANALPHFSGISGRGFPAGSFGSLLRIPA
jgi:hypothetical protein